MNGIQYRSRGRDRGRFTDTFGAERPGRIETLHDVDRERGHLRAAEEAYLSLASQDKTEHWEIVECMEETMRSLASVSMASIMAATVSQMLIEWMPL